MSALLVALFGLVVVAAVAAVVVSGIVALRNKSSFEADSQLAPGVTTSAPTSWAGSHTPEALLHRRLRDALSALEANQAFDDDGGMLDVRVELRQQAAALDEQLVATAAIAPPLREGPLAQISGAVQSVEQAVADLAGASSADAAGRLTALLADIRSRTGLVAQARAALDAMDPVAQPAPVEQLPAQQPQASPPEPPPSVQPGS